MADYTPLLTRAVTGQDEAARAGIYARARDALERQLRAFEPKLEEAQIQAELEGLEASIRTVEAQAAGIAPAQPAAEGTEEALPTGAEPPAEAPTAPVEARADEVLPQESEPQQASVEEPTREAPAPEEPAPEEPAPVSAESSLAPQQVSEVLRTASTDEVSAPGLDEPIIAPVARPRMPLRSEARPSRKPLAIAGGIALMVILAIGALALVRRGTPDPLASRTAPAQQTAALDTSKTEGRLTGETTPAPAPTPSEPARPTAPAGQSAAPEAPLATSSRAFMVIENPGAAPNQYEGRAIWSFEPDAGNKAEKALRTLIAFPGADITIDFAITRNLDAGIDASHLLMVIFDMPKGASAVREMSPVEWREREATQGSVLRGGVVPVQDNAFMLTLDKAAREANLTLMRAQKWIVFEFRFANGRRGAVLAEKGGTGDKAIGEALASWK